MLHLISISTTLIFWAPDSTAKRTKYQARVASRLWGFFWGLSSRTGTPKPRKRTNTSGKVFGRPALEATATCRVDASPTGGSPRGTCCAPRRSSCSSAGRAYLPAKQYTANVPGCGLRSPFNNPTKIRIFVNEPAPNNWLYSILLRWSRVCF